MQCLPLRDLHVVLSFSIVLAACCVVPSRAVEPGYRIVESPNQVQVMHGDNNIATYAIRSGNKPIVWPLLGPDAVAMTRAYPMVADTQNEKHDHIHHRSLWFTHGEVNGVDFWAEGDKSGIVQHKKFVKLSATPQNAVIEAINDWNAKSGEQVLQESRRLTFHGTNDVRMIDCEFQLTAAKKDVHFGDTKEGTFAIRMAESMKVEAKLGGKIINAEGKSDAATWGQMSPWVDYTGPIGDQTYGIAILCHPSSFRSPGRWHVRTYGLFAHNPFGLKDFVNDPQAQGGGYTLPQGEKMLFAYRVILHRGTTEQANIASAWIPYRDTKLEPLSNN